MAGYNYPKGGGGGGEISCRWVLFDELITEAEMRRLLAPTEPETFSPGFVTFEGSILLESEICDRVREYERTTLATIKAKQAAKYAAASRARFEAYYASLGLDDTLDIPETISVNKRRQQLD